MEVVKIRNAYVEAKTKEFVLLYIWYTAIIVQQMLMPMIFWNMIL